MRELKVAQLYKADKLEAKMEAWGKSIQRQQAEAHKLACSVLLHFGQYKDVRMIHRFILLVPDMVRANGLRSWFEAHAKVKFIVNELPSGETEEQIVYVKDKWPDTVTKEAVKLGEAIQKPFWKFKAVEGAPYKPIVESEWVQNAIKRLRQDTAKTGADHSQLLRALETYDKAPVGPVPAEDDPLNIARPAVDPLAQENTADPVV